MPKSDEQLTIVTLAELAETEQDNAGTRCRLIVFTIKAFVNAWAYPGLLGLFTLGVSELCSDQLQLVMRADAQHLQGQGHLLKTEHVARLFLCTGTALSHELASSPGDGSYVLHEDLAECLQNLTILITSRTIHCCMVGTYGVC